MIEISAIISTYNRAHFLKGLFSSVLEQSIDKSRYEIVIVNNNCTDNTEEICHKFIQSHPEVKINYCIEKQQGLSYGRNKGIEESIGSIVTFLDDDAIIAPDFFEKTLLFFSQHPDVNAIGGKILLKYIDKKPNWYNPFLASLLGYFNKGDKEQIFNNDYFRGSNMSFRREIFLTYGGFNTLLGRVGRNLMGNEEKELFYRFKSNGEKMWYVPSTVAYHLVPIERTYSSFVKKQAIGTGISQRQHALINGKLSFLICIFSEIAKWGVSIILMFFYFITLGIPIAIMLIRFRWWVSKGIFSRQNDVYDISIKSTIKHPGLDSQKKQP
jgi:glucosyl-dolichyl phosphate glucuronosyltransferase